LDGKTDGETRVQNKTSPFPMWSRLGVLERLMARKARFCCGLEAGIGRQGETPSSTSTTN